MAIDHHEALSGDMKQLLLNQDSSDVILIVGGIKYPAHKTILSTRSSYFHSLFHGGLKETRKSEVELKDVNATAFMTLLEYLYTGKVNLTAMGEDALLKLLW